MTSTIKSAISNFGASAKKKLSNAAVTGQPEDQLRAPFEALINELNEALKVQSDITMVGETPVQGLNTRPDYAVTLGVTLIGHIELKAPGKGADPRQFRDKHDKEQWQKLRSLPNLLYCDGNEFSLWQEGELHGHVRLIGSIETAGGNLDAPAEFAMLIERFLTWAPIPPRSVKDLARITARLCRLLREEVAEQLLLKNPALSGLAADWRRLLFPDASDERFADGYAQAVVFGVLVARARGIDLAKGIDAAGVELAKSSTLIGSALHVLTQNAASHHSLKTSLLALTRVLNVVDWKTLSKGNTDAWLYFYEDFLEIYDNTLRKQTGSYYTPPEVVEAMVRLVHEELQGPGFGLSEGISSPTITLADPATGTGTYILGVLRKIRDVVAADRGEGAVAEVIHDVLTRMHGFEIQLGPFAVAELRIFAEVLHLTGELPKSPLKLYVTNTLGDPFEDEGYLPSFLGKIAETRKAANKVKRESPITVVIGNPPYKEKAKGKGGWVEERNKNDQSASPLEAWIPPADWGVSAHTKHLRNLYVYFWRWATWKVFDHHQENQSGIVCFITVAGFLGGDGFQRMRDYLRRTCDAIWVIDCSPEGHQPEVKTRIFEDVQQPVCIVMASRSAIRSESKISATTKYMALAKGSRQDKLTQLSKLRLDSHDWVECSSDFRAPFFPKAEASWASFPSLNSFFNYDGSGVMPGRTWVIAPDAQSLLDRWQRLVQAPPSEKEALFHPHLNLGKPGDRHVNRVVADSLHGFPSRPLPVGKETQACLEPVRYAYRSFDRQWIIPDNRLINRANPKLWLCRHSGQVFITALAGSAPRSGPSITVSANIPDMDHYKGSFGGRVFPLTLDDKGTKSNIKTAVTKFLADLYGQEVDAEDVFAYVVSILSCRSFVEYFKQDLLTPGLRVPLTADPAIFFQGVELGRRVIWLSSFGERMVNAGKGRPPGPPRIAPGTRPKIPAGGEIQKPGASFPRELRYDEALERLHVGDGYIDNVSPQMWEFEVSGKQIISQWFSYRRENRERPAMGDKRPSSALSSVQPKEWPGEYTTELINVLNVLGLLSEMDESLNDVLEGVLINELVTVEDLDAALAFEKDDILSPSENSQADQMSLI
jgi:Type ISP C-terminal specificity domain/N-6 DNA Methylase